jgi:hypothetical protein
VRTKVRMPFAADMRTFVRRQHLRPCSSHCDDSLKKLAHILLQARRGERKHGTAPLSYCCIEREQEHEHEEE